MYFELLLVVLRFVFVVFKYIYLPVYASCYIKCFSGSVASGGETRNSLGLFFFFQVRQITGRP